MSDADLGYWLVDCAAVVFRKLDSQLGLGLRARRLELLSELEDDSDWSMTRDLIIDGERLMLDHPLI